MQFSKQVRPRRGLTPRIELFREGDPTQRSTERGRQTDPRPVDKIHLGTSDPVHNRRTDNRSSFRLGSGDRRSTHRRGDRLRHALHSLFVSNLGCRSRPSAGIDGSVRKTLRRRDSMRLILEGEDRIRLEMAGEGLEILSEGAPLSPFHLLAASLASCTALAVSPWAAGAGLAAAPRSLSGRRARADTRPKRVTRMAMELRWPGRPAARVATAERLAEPCPIHATLQRAVELSHRITASD